MEYWELKQKQSLPLEVKIEMTKRRIKEYYKEYEGDVYISFSGGKDSTVLLHIAREIYPDMKAVFVNTGLEYTEIINFVRSFENVVFLKPDLSFKEVLDTYGYPVGSKFIARQIRTLSNPTPNNKATCHLYKTGFRRDGHYSGFSHLGERWQKFVGSRWKVSEKCCDIMKKNPIKEFEKSSGLHGVIGTMAGDSAQRRMAYLKTGCNSFGNHGISRPMSFWIESDVWEYIRSRKLRYSDIYDKGVKRTGCVFCMFGVHLEKSPNRFELMKESNPALYKYCIEKLELSKILDFMNVKY